MLRCGPLAAVAHHLFSTRELDLEAVRGDGSTRWHDLADALGVDIESLARMRQVHRAEVFAAEKKLPEAFSVGAREKDARSLFSDGPQADIAVTGAPTIAVSVRTADCVPILLADRRTGAIAAVHAGWKGTAEGAAIVAVRALVSRYGSNPRDVIAAVGPSIGPCCYEVGPELAGHFSSHPQASTWFTRDAKPRLDLWRATRDQLAIAGVPPPHIHVCALCTFDHAAVFHSYRRDGANAGRLVAAIRSGPGRMP